MTTEWIVGIAGASGSGKSSLAANLVSRLAGQLDGPEVVVLSEDAYYRSRTDLTFQQRSEVNYDHPDVFEHSLLLQHLRELRAGKPVDVPQYDYATHLRKTEVMRVVPPRLLVVEGILIFHDPALRSEFNLSLFVDVPLETCLERRLVRDTGERGRTRESVLEQFEATVRPMYFEFVEPTRKWADMIVPGGGQNQTALDVLSAFFETRFADR
ncbi:MAG: uridine kinase [Planctomycetota bacterium]|nr:uridine kinase [Planctomycetota bacterium]